MLGVWCHDGTKYVRGDCTRENDSWMLLSPRSIEWVESGCRASSIRKLTPNLDDVQYYCEGEGEKWKVRVQFLYSNGNTLRMHEMRRGAVRGGLPPQPPVNAASARTRPTGVALSLHPQAVIRSPATAGHLSFAPLGVRSSSDVRSLDLFRVRRMYHQSRHDMGRNN